MIAKHLPPKRPVIFMPTWDLKLASVFTKRNFKVSGIYSDPHDVVCFVDGPPISPFFYGQKKIPELKCDLSRDMEEMSLLRMYGAAKPKIGFGRGAHLLNIFNGGSAWQRVTNHIGPTVHKAVSWLDGTEMWLHTAHEQVMIHADTADILAVARHNSTSYTSDKGSILAKDMVEAIDLEACYYPNTNSLCYQPNDLTHEPTAALFFSLAQDSIRYLKDGVEF